jgi:phosphatidylserine/phosphatidylglycerophosphate/cardiolipin synthase-like enzyme
VWNRVGFAKDKPKSGEYRPSDVWPFQRFNWTDHAVGVGDKVRYRITAMIDAGAGKPFKKGPSSAWTGWIALSSDVGDGFSCFFNRGLALSQFAARYMRDKKLSSGQFKNSLKGNVDPKFREFLAGDLGARLLSLMSDTKSRKQTLHLALYELGDGVIQNAIVSAGSARLKLILANGSEKPDGNLNARNNLNEHGIPTIDRLLGSQGLGHNKFAVISDSTGPMATWTGSTNWSTTGLCTQINNGLLIENRAIAEHYLDQWNRLKKASPPSTKPAGFPATLTSANDKGKTFAVSGGASVRVRFTRTTDGSDMKELEDLINSAKHAVLFLMFTPGSAGLHVLAGKRSNEPGMYVRGVVSTVGNQKGDSDKNYVDVRLVGRGAPKATDRYTVVQPQGAEELGSWIAEVTRGNFLSQIGHAIVHSKVLVIDLLDANCAVATGSHNFSTPASKRNDENLVIVRGQRALAEAYAVNVMSVYQHYRFRSYVRETLARGKKPWSYLDLDDKWLKQELKSKALEISYWA